MARLDVKTMGLQQPPFLDLLMPMSSPYPFRMWVPA